MTPAELREMLAKASPGPFRAELDFYGDEVEGIQADVVNDGTTMLAHLATETAPSSEGWDKAKHSQQLKDAQMIAAAMNALPVLLDVAEAAMRTNHIHEDREIGGKVVEIGCDLCAALEVLVGSK